MLQYDSLLLLAGVGGGASVRVVVDGRVLLLSGGDRGHGVVVGVGVVVQLEK